MKANTVNPFCTAQVRPGALPFFFAGDDSLPLLLKRLQANKGWGQIVGPHGSGKSTLLAAFIPLLEKEGCNVWHYSLHDGERRLPKRETPLLSLHASTQIVVDGYEQLSRLETWKLKRRCKRHGWGLLVTAHADVGLPLLYQTAISSALVAQIIEKLLPGDQAILSQEEIASVRKKHGQDIRETLFALYDIWEANSGDKRAHE